MNHFSHPLFSSTTELRDTCELLVSLLKKKKKRKFRHKRRTQGGAHMKTKAETGVMCLPATQKMGRARAGSCPRNLRRILVLLTP